MSKSNTGVWAEKQIQKHLEGWVAADSHREANRLTDAKAAGRIIKAAAADFEYFCLTLSGDRRFGLIEVKETEHDYRIGRDRITQLPRMRKRDKCGGQSYVVVYHTKIKLWRCVTVGFLASTGDKGSWNLTECPTFETCGEALAHASDGVLL